MLTDLLTQRFGRFEVNLAWIPLTIFLATALLVLSASYASLFTENRAKIPALRGYSIVHAWAFFNKRYDFMRSNFERTGHSLFSFRVLQHQVVAMSGDEARKIFFTEKGLNFTEGYRLLMGAAPKLDDIEIDVSSDDAQVTVFIKRLLKLLRKDRLQDVSSKLFSDINGRMEAWGSEGTLNPFNDIHQFVLQMTVRMASCEELASDPRAVQRLGELYWMLEKSATPLCLLLPWFPSTAKKQKEQATQGLYDLLSHYVDVRRKDNVRNSDAIDVLIADGVDNDNIVGFVLSTIFAGVINTGMLSSWVLVHLGANTEWREKAIDEIRNFMDKYSNTTSSEAIHQRLSSIPISAWEEDMPVLEDVIRESMRLVLAGTAIRRNLVDSLQVDGKTIDKGVFMAYNVGEVHLNEEIYPEPQKFDPNRYSAPREEDKRGNMVFLGWGAGRHPCAGMKVAKFEIKMILALVLSRFEVQLVDGSGNPRKELPLPDRNDIHQARPMESCFLKYRKLDMVS